MLITAQKSAIVSDRPSIGKALDQFREAKKRISMAKPNNHSSIINDQSKIIPSYSETAVWCELTEGIDPAEWARICRKIGHLSPDQFQKAREMLFPANSSQNQGLFSRFGSFKPVTSKNPDSMMSRLKRLFCFDQCDFEHLPLVSISPEGLTQTQIRH